MKLTAKLLGVILFGLAVGACDKCGGFKLGLSGWTAPIACGEAPKPQG